MGYITTEPELSKNDCSSHLADAGSIFFMASSLQGSGFQTFWSVNILKEATIFLLTMHLL